VIDVNAFVGSYPFRRVPGTSPEALRQSLDRVGITEAWVTHLPGLFWHDPGEGNPWLYRMCAEDPRLRPVPLVHPGLPGWEQGLDQAAAQRVPAVRCDPGYFGLPPAGAEMRRLVGAAAKRRVPLLVAVRLEDGRQRHPNDVAPELPAWAVRALIREAPDARLIVTHADRAFVEEVHFGSTAEEAARLWWDISWLWGPPEDHLALLLETIGSRRFLFGTGQPLRLPENSVAKLDLLDLSPEIRHMIESDNARDLLRW
jgi:predicted TIM-barrel fold metal-dependent hydrolase